MRLPLGYPADGRIEGAFVYLLICSDSDDIHIKIGQSYDPEKRFHSLRTACPLIPRSFAVVKTPSKKIAVKLERALHKAFKEWRSTGEWFCFKMDQKPEFNWILRTVLEDQSMPLWPMKVTKVSAHYLMELARQRKFFAQRRFMRRGQAYKDFCKDSDSKC